MLGHSAAFCAYNRYMAKDVIHISELEAVRDFAGVMERVREGAEVFIEKDARPVAVIHAVGEVRGNSDVRNETDNVELTTGISTASREFFAAYTFEELARAQGVHPLTRSDGLTGGWPADESVDEFIETTYQTRG